MFVNMFIIITISIYPLLEVSFIKFNLMQREMINRHIFQNFIKSEKVMKFELGHYFFRKEPESWPLTLNRKNDFIEFSHLLGNSFLSLIWFLFVIDDFINLKRKFIRFFYLTGLNKVICCT